MAGQTKRIAVLGSTGSIGRNALEVIAASHGALTVAALSAHRDVDTLVEQARDTGCPHAVASDAERVSCYDFATLPRGCQLHRGSEGLEAVARLPEVDVVLAAIVGSAGIRSAWAALDAGKALALANKETLVMGGSLVTNLARERGVQILPVDSEHSAIFQALHAGRRSELKRVILTASGGPFRLFTQAEMEAVTVADALKHPTWRMGPKITVDSATMMNKALEMIEARWLFDLSAEQIEVVIHPQSIVHSMVEFVDGSTVAQLSPPDMRLPIHYALHYPERQPSIAKTMDWSRTQSLEFSPPDRERFPALDLGYQCVRDGGTTGAVLNASNEAAVAMFLAGELPFIEIVPACRAVLEHHHFESQPSLERLFALDAWARQEVGRWVCT